MKILKRYRNECLSCYIRMCKDSVNKEIGDHKNQIRKQVSAFVSAMRDYQKCPGLSGASVSLAYRLSDVFFEGNEVKVEAMHRFLLRVGKTYQLDFYAFDLFFDFLRFHAIKRIYHNRKTGKSKEVGDMLRLLQDMEHIPREQWLGQVSCVERQLLTDDIYAVMTEKSKGVYRQKIAKMAQKSDKTVQETVDFLIKSAQKEGKHLGFLLKTEKNSVKKWLYFSLLALSTILGGVQFYFFVGNLFLAGVSLIPSYFAAKVFVGQLMAALLPNDYLVRLQKDAAPVMKRHCCVLIPSLLTQENIGKLGEKLEMLYLQNRSANAVYGLLLDLPESDSRVLPMERKQKKDIQAYIDRLNDRYGKRFFVCIRKRTFSPTQQKYIGADRKRGAIEEWIEMVSGGGKTMAVYGASAKKTEYLLVLDQDTEPEIDSLRELVSIACHPLHRPVYDEKRKRIVNGYGVLSPSVLAHPLRGRHTLLGRLLLSVGSTFQYPVTHHELYQDLFHAGSFCGKGLIDVQAYRQTISGRLPREQILSHDLLEGALLRTGYVSDISCFESQPDTVVAYYKREHRWIRGDWQLLRGAKGISLSGVDRYKMIENGLRSIWPMVTMFLTVSVCLIGGLSCLGGILLAWMPILAVPYLLILHQVLLGTTLSHRVCYYAGQLPAFEGALAWSLFELLSIPYRAYNGLDAVVRALYRQFCSRRHLLDWTVFAQKQNQGVFSYRPILFAELILMLLGVLFVFRLSWWAVLFFIWAGVPLLFLWLSRDIQIKADKLTKDQQEQVRVWAQRTWDYMRDHLCKKDHYLLPDHHQIEPNIGVAHRTSPTNIGLSLVGVMAACDLGFIDTNEMVERIGQIIDSVEVLERWRGHLYNWYDTRSRQPMAPHYISSVDSGNFVVCLAVLVQGLEQYRNQHAAIPDLINRIRKQEAMPDFVKLYDPQRKWLHIGYRPQEQALDDHYYDLMMSEARLTSYYLCANGVLPKEHWLALTYPYITDKGRFGLASWTGSIFEYGMPLMFMPLSEGTQQYEAIHFALHEQRKWAGTRPFGVSESGYYDTNQDNRYAYKGMGTPKLGSQNGLAEDYVVSPYSTFLSLPLLPRESFDNLTDLQREGLFGRYGFYEAIDYTPTRVGNMPRVVKTFMAHHMGMSLISCANVLCDRIFIRRFLQDARMRAYLPLVQNGLPNHVIDTRG